MDILFCELLDQGAWTIHVRGLARGLSQLGHNVTLLRGQISQSEMETAANRRLSLWTNRRRKLLRLRLVQRFRGEINILFAALREIYVFLLVFCAIVRQRRRFNIIYRRHALFNSERLLARLFKITHVKEVNGIKAEENKVMRAGDKLSLRVIDRLERFGMSRTDKIIVVTEKLKAVLRHDYGVASDRIVVIQIGADTDLFQPIDIMEARKELDLSLDSNYVGFVGTLIEWQGVDYLVRSAPLILEEYPQTYFLIVGDGPMRQALIELAEQTGVIDRMLFTGPVTHQRVPLYINASDICVTLKKPMKSGFSPLKLYEYMACAKPVIATRTDGFEILEECNAGLLVNPEDRRQLADTITTLLNNKELRMEMGGNGREYVVKNQSWSSVAARVAAVCEQAIKGN
jgi:starch synthase